MQSGSVDHGRVAVRDADPIDAVERRLARARSFAVVAGLVVVGLGSTALVGWLAGAPILTSFVPGLATMKFNTAVGIVLVGAALVVLLRAPEQRVLMRGLAIGAIVLGGLSALEYLTGSSFGIDELIVPDPGGSAFPGRMSPITAVGFVAIGLTTLAFSSGRPSRLGVLAGLLTLGVAVLTLIGYLYDVSDLYRFGPFSSVSVPTAVAFALVSLGLLLDRPIGITRWAFGDGPGGELIRRLLPPSILIPMTLGFVVLAAIRSGSFGSGIGLAALVTGLIGTLLFLIYRSGAALDRTEAIRLRAEQAAREAVDREAVVTVTVADAIVTIDADSTIRFVNPATDRIFGYPPGSLVGQSLTTLMPTRMRDQHRRGLARHMATGDRHIEWEGTELIGRRANGDEFPIDVSFADSGTGENRAFTGIIRDISARKRLEGQLLQAQRLESVGRLAGGIAHDFNNILTAMLGFTQLVLDDLPADDPRRDDVEAIRVGGERAGKLVRQLLAFSRKQVLHPQTVAVAEVIQDIVPMLSPLIGSSVEVTIDRLDSSAVVLADRGQLEQVIVNLAVNARDAMPDGGRLTMEVVIVDLDVGVDRIHPGLTPGRHVQLTVSDTGIGMDEETREHIFEPFFTTKSEGLGTGLGLATVYGIVQQSGGRIWVYSEPGHGSTFRMLFPLASTEPTEVDLRSADRRSASGRGQRILVVEDEALIRDLIEKVLVRDGYVVVLAEDVSGARDRLAAESFDLVLTDVVMPGGSGLDLARALDVERPDLPVVLMSGYSAAALLDLSVGDRTAELVEKPFTPNALLAVVQRVLERGR